MPEYTVLKDIKGNVNGKPFSFLAYLEKGRDIIKGILHVEDMGMVIYADCGTWYNGSKDKSPELSTIGVIQKDRSIKSLEGETSNGANVQINFAFNLRDASVIVNDGISTTVVTMYDILVENNKRINMQAPLTEKQLEDNEYPIVTVRLDLLQRWEVEPITDKPVIIEQVKKKLEGLNENSVDVNFGRFLSDLGIVPDYFDNVISEFFEAFIELAHRHHAFDWVRLMSNLVAHPTQISDIACFILESESKVELGYPERYYAIMEVFKLQVERR